MKRHFAWAVEAKLWPDKPMTMLGIGWFDWPKEAHVQGCRTALFSTRREARDHARYARGKGQVAVRVIRVEVSITRGRG